MNMNKLRHLFLVSMLALVACTSTPTQKDAPTSSAKGSDAVVLVTVDGATLTQDDLIRDMPKGWTGDDSVTFAKMYVDNWVLKQLKMKRATELLPLYEEYIERLVEDYRQSLIMRQLDQHYIDNDIDHIVTDQQIATYYRAHASEFKLNHNEVKGIIVKVDKSFRNTKTLTTALVEARKTQDVTEIMALAEKLNLNVTDLTAKWITFSDFLAYLPTVSTNSYDYLLSNSSAQVMHSDDATFHFIFTDVARKGSTSPLELVVDDIQRRLYAERRADIVSSYEEELRREALVGKRITFHDKAVEQLLGYEERLMADDDKVDTEIIVESVEESESENESDNE